MRDLHFPWLELSILVPALAAVVLYKIRDQRFAQQVAFWASGLTVCLTIGEWIDFGTLGTFSAQDHGSLVRRLFGRDFFVVDELSAPLLPMTAILFSLTILATMRSKAGRFSFWLVMASEAIILATLSCSFATVLILLLLLSTLPPWIEMRKRGSDTRVFAIYMSAHIAMLIVGIVLMRMWGQIPIISNTAAFLLVLSSLIRAGVFPAHSWISDLFEKTTFGTALLFVAPMTGAYVVMRLVLPVVPVWALHAVAVLALVTAVYAAGMSLVQFDARRFFAYLFLSHSSLVLAGLEIATPIGMTGALCIWLGTGLSLGGFALALRSVEARIGRISLAQYHGLFDHMPYLGSLFLLAGLASIGFPGSLAFVGMELLVEGTVEVYPIVGMMIVLAAVLNGISVLRAYFRIFTGTRHVATISLSARPAERFVVIIIILLVLGAGVWPGAAVKSRYHAADILLKNRQATGIDHGSETIEPDGQSALDELLNIHEDEPAGH
ncbi:MAG TPA: oxidoreductase [Planctomycetaceae bacterium]|nr:oxidoreductase [Planctomycetaceae bacterium]